MTEGQIVTFSAADGTSLVGTIFEPAGSARSAVLIAGGLGIPQRFYAPFGSWLARRGHRAMSFDLRGMGASRLVQHQRSLRGLDADMLTWARLDFAAAVRHLWERNDHRQIGLIGHSLGMHHAGMTGAEAQGRIRRAVSVAAGSGYWRDWAPPSRRLAPLLLHLASPLLTPLFGYFPGRRLRMVGDLPGPAMRQWTRWCRHPDFAWGAEPEQVVPSLITARFPIDAFCFTDDDAMTEGTARKLLAAFREASTTLRVIAPADLGLDSIGHVGAFRRAAEQALWPLLEEALGTD